MIILKNRRATEWDKLASKIRMHESSLHNLDNNQENCQRCRKLMLQRNTFYVTLTVNYDLERKLWE